MGADVSHTPEVVQVVVSDTSQTKVKVQQVDPRWFAYHHKQGASSAVWEIRHNLGFYPNVTVMDSGESQIEGELEHLTKNTLRIIFSVPISGDAYLS
jgi:hypothetical protein